MLWFWRMRVSVVFMVKEYRVETYITLKVTIV